MGMRKYYRAIAKERLKAVGADANKAFGTGLERGFVRKKRKFRKGRRLLARYREAYQPLWKRVLWGKDAKAAEAALMRGPARRRRANAAR